MVVTDFFNHEQGHASAHSRQLDDAPPAPFAHRDRAPDRRHPVLGAAYVCAGITQPVDACQKKLAPSRIFSAETGTPAISLEAKDH